MNLKAAAAYLGLTKATVRTFALDGQLPGDCAIGHGGTGDRWTFTQADLDAFIDSHRILPGDIGETLRSRRT